MGCLSFLCKSSAVIVAVFAICVGCLSSGLLTKIGLFDYLDGLQDEQGRQMFKGVAPVCHANVPWGYTAEQIPDLEGRTYVVTGANVGLGYWTSYHLANHGGKVVMACRSEKKCQAAVDAIQAETGAKSDLFIPMVLDLSSFASIRTFAAALKDKIDSLDSLIENAGIMAPPFALTVDGLETQIGVNHFGHFLLAQELLPLIQQAAATKGWATVSVVSSNAHYGGYPDGVRLSIEEINDEASYIRQLAYGQSKLANVLFAQELAERLKPKNIFVNVIHPGGVDTDLFRDIYDAITKYLGEGASAWFQSQMALALWHPRDAALTQVYAAVADEIKEKEISGQYFHPIARPANTDPHAKNMAMQKALWKLTEEYVNAH